MEMLRSTFLTECVSPTIDATDELLAAYDSGSDEESEGIVAALPATLFVRPALKNTQMTTSDLIFTSGVDSVASIRSSWGSTENRVVTSPNHQN